MGDGDSTSVPPAEEPSSDDAPGSTWSEFVETKREPLAIPAFITAVLGLVPFGLGLGMVAFRRGRRSDSRGVGLAAAAIVVSLVWLVVGASWAVSFFTDRYRDFSGHIVAARDVARADLRVGDCYSATPDQDPAGRDLIVRAKPCQQPHTSQVFAVAQRDQAGDYSVARTACLRAARDLPAAATQSDAQVKWLMPPRLGTLGEYVDNKVICSLYTDEPRTRDLSSTR